MKHTYMYKAMMLVLTACAVTACSSDQLSEYERVKEAFADQLGTTIAPTQTWRTAVKIKLNVLTDAPAEVWLMTGSANGVVYDYREVSTSSLIELTAPQDNQHTIYLVSLCNQKKHVQEVQLSGKLEESVTLNLKGSYAAAAADADDGRGASSSLYGHSIAGNAQYNEFTEGQKDEALAVLKDSYKEGVDAKTLKMNCDYELVSNGSFKITWFAGNTKSALAHTLGYYYHTPGTYDDITYVDLSETELYDYIDGLAKVQYQVNDAAAAQYGVLPNHWYDANFDIGDTFDNPHPYIDARRGDDAYNTIAIYDRYRNNISALRGIAFDINVPKGKKIGFYLRSDDSSMPEQYDIFTKLGIRPYTTRDKFKAMNFSCEAMNIKALGNSGNHRSCVVEHEHSLWLGMEDSYDGGDFDCNDIIFGITADIDVQKPDIAEPDVIDTGDKGPWTLAFEDVYRDADFDFNDAVIKIVPDYEREQCCVTVEAAGSPARMYLHYDGPDGDQNLGELHELLGGNLGERINTTSSMAQTPFVQVDCVNWPKTYTAQKDAGRFYIEIQRGTCQDCTDRLSLTDTAGELPQALLIAGDWRWPRETTPIMSAYPSFAPWASDNTNRSVWHWYGSPQEGSVVSH